jgi:hypothetical protein
MKKNEKGLGNNIDERFTVYCIHDDDSCAAPKLNKL